jgi:hypothetical protein
MRGMGFWKHGGYGGLGFLHKHYTGSYVPARAGFTRPVDCPERKEQVHFTECIECELFRVWDEQDGDLRRCYHEFRDLKSRGHYDGTWDDHPENFDPETFAEIQEKKRRNEEINREMKLERAELERRGEELVRNGSADEYDEFHQMEEVYELEEEEKEADQLDYEEEEELIQ